MFEATGDYAVISSDNRALTIPLMVASWVLFALILFGSFTYGNIFFSRPAQLWNAGMLVLASVSTFVHFLVAAGKQEIDKRAGSISKCRLFLCKRINVGRITGVRIDAHRRCCFNVYSLTLVGENGTAEVRRSTSKIVLEHHAEMIQEWLDAVSQCNTK